MELALCVNNALYNLRQHMIVCTDSFRVVNAGKIKYACFDKTGTLTTDKMVVNGISYGLNDSDLFAEMINLQNVDNLIKPKDFNIINIYI